MVAARLLSWRPVVILILGWVLAASKECQQSQSESKPPSLESENRVLRKKLAPGRIEAPNVTLPNGRVWNIGHYVHWQLYPILFKSPHFVLSPWTPEDLTSTGLDDDWRRVWRQCGLSSEVQGSQAYSKGQLSPLAPCMWQVPQAYLEGAILDFHLISAGGVKVGIKDIPFLKGFGVQFKVLELSGVFNLVHPLMWQQNSKRVIATTESRVYQKSLSSEVEINLGIIQLGLRHYFETPLRYLVDQILQDSLNQLAQTWNSVEPWYALVIRNCDKFIFINAGHKTDANLRPGDILRIQNVAYLWEGPACRSQLLGSLNSIEGPYGYAEVVAVGDTLSAARLIDNDPQFPVDGRQMLWPGARVYVEKLAPSGVSSRP